MAACDIFSPPFSAIFAPVFNTSKSCLEQHFFLDILPSAQSPPHSLPSQGRKNIQYLKFARIANGGHWIVNVIVRVVVRNCQNICSLKFTFSFYVHFQKRQKIFTYYSADSPTGVESDSQADRQIFVVFASVIFFIRSYHRHIVLGSDQHFAQLKASPRVSNKRHHCHQHHQQNRIKIITALK